MVNKIGKADSKFWILLGILVIALLHSANVIDIGAIFGTAAAPEETQAGVNGFCAIEDTTYTFVDADFYDAGTSPISVAADDAYAVFVDGVKKDGAYASGDSLTLSPGSKIDVYYYDDAKDNSMFSANTKHWSFVVPCKGTLDNTFKLYDLGAAAAATDGTWVILDDTYTSIKTTTGYDMSKGQSKSAELKYTYVADDAFGSPDGKNCLVFHANKSLVKNIKLGGKEDQGCSPSGLVIDPIKSTDNEIWSFIIDPFVSNTQYTSTISIELESGDLGEPIGADASHDVNMTVFDQQWFYNANNGEMELGYEDEDNTLIGAVDLNTWFGIQ